MIPTKTLRERMTAAVAAQLQPGPIVRRHEPDFVATVVDAALQAIDDPCLIKTADNLVPSFTLLGHDPHAEVLVNLWALWRYYSNEDEETVAEALACANAMYRWRAEHTDKPPFEGADALYLKITEAMDDHPDGFEHECGCDACMSYAEP